VARQPEVFLRELTPDEAQRLVKITRTARDRVRLRRAGIVLASLQGRTATEAAAMFAAELAGTPVVHFGLEVPSSRSTASRGSAQEGSGATWP
jgi:hypothetical protein